MSKANKIIILMAILSVMVLGILSCDNVDSDKVKKPIFHKPGNENIVLNPDDSKGVNISKDVILHSGNYNTDIHVAISTPTKGAIIYYTTDGSKPTKDSKKYEAPITMAGYGTVTTIKAIAKKTGMEDSNIASATYKIDESGIYYPTWLKPQVPFIPESFPLKIHWYGIMYVLVALTTYILLKVQAKNNKFVTSDNVDFIFIWGVIGAILGARLGHAIFIQPELWLKPWRIILPVDPEQGWKFTGIAGMTFYGGVFGLLFTIWTYCRVKRVNFYSVGDMLAAAFPLGYTFGRLGNFFNQEFVGRPAPSWLPWKMYFGMEGQYQAVARHPSQIYEALLQGVILWVVIWFIVKPRKLWDGMLMGVYLSGYGLARLITDFLRIRNDPLSGIFFLSTTQLIDIGLIILGIVVMYVTKAFPNKYARTFEQSKDLTKNKNKKKKDEKSSNEVSDNLSDDTSNA